MDIPLKETIYNFLKANPGTHSTGDVAPGTPVADVSEALSALERENRVECKRGAGGLLPRWTVVAGQGADLKEKIWAFLRDNPGEAGHTAPAIAAAVVAPGSPASTVNGSLYALQKEGRAMSHKGEGSKPRWTVGDGTPRTEVRAPASPDSGLKDKICEFLTNNLGAHAPGAIAKAVVGPKAPRSSVNAALYSLEKDGRVSCAKAPDGTKPQWSMARTTDATTTATTATATTATATTATATTAATTATTATTAAANSSELAEMPTLIVPSAKAIATN